jgi:broad specificity phosphatase PhoE
VTRLIYVRHGESTSTVERRIGGPRTCTGLSDLGRQQSARLRDRWAAGAEVRPDLLIASQYPRAQQTAEIVGEAFPGVALEIEPGFGEHDPGRKCDGMSFHSFVQEFGEDSWESDPFGISFPGGETLAEFHFRVGATIRRTTDRLPGATIVVFCHGGVVESALRQALKTPWTGGFHVWTLNTSITELELTKPNQWRLYRYGDAAHLAGLPSATPIPDEQLDRLPETPAE